MSAPALAARDLVVDLAGRRILNGASLEIHTGELTSLVGPNGAGKTTLLRSLLGLIPLRSGVVELRGTSRGSGRGSRGAIGYVPQRHEFAWEFPASVQEVVMTGRVGKLGLFRRPGVEDWKRVAKSLAMVRMSEFAERPIAELSGGQRQRVLVARALALGSDILVLDEPFTGLDMPTQELLGELFVELARDGRAVLTTTHDLVHAMTASDRVAVLSAGTISASGTPAELAEPGIWASAFGVAEASPLVKSLQAVIA
ncbi:anchored repeat-type ABC transporter ATP-binding subunit [Pseudoclavibacter albus]|uniref:anchored repeat-type ABC transporter ATP-binding subunit n=1 Tax=Pseudoclavibacter albus TaxID=272241 RepID=UPI0030B95AAC